MAKKAAEVFEDRAPPTDKIEIWVKVAFDNPHNAASEQELREACNLAINKFLKCDADHSGKIDDYELIVLCQEMGLPIEIDTEKEELLSKGDTAKGKLGLDSFVPWWLKRVGCLPNPQKQQEANARYTFEKYDKDGNGTLDASELQAFLSALGADFTEAEMLEAFAQLDTDSGGTIDKEEFIAWWTNRAADNRKGGGIVALKLKRLAAKASGMFSSDIFTAAWNNDLNLVKQFLAVDSRMANTTDVSEYGNEWTPLHYAAYQGNADVVAELIKERAKVNAINIHGFNPLFYAAQQYSSTGQVDCQRSHLSTCQALLDAQADPGAVGEIVDEKDINACSMPVGGVFLCAADLAMYSPELRDLFSKHPACKAPEAIPTEKINASVDDYLVLHITPLPAQRIFTKLPIRIWKLTLSCDINSEAAAAADDSMEVPDPLEMEVAANPPRISSIDTPIDGSWFRKALFKSVWLTIVAVNSLGECSPGSRRIAVQYRAPPRRPKGKTSITDGGATATAGDNDEPAAESTEVV